MPLAGISGSTRSHLRSNTRNDGIPRPRDGKRALLTPLTDTHILPSWGSEGGVPDSHVVPRGI